MATATVTSTWVNENHDVRALVNYLPVEKQVFQPDDLKKPNTLSDFIPSSRYMTFHNARGKEDAFQLDRNGFQFCTLPDKERDFSTDEQIQQVFFPEVEDIIRKMTGASHVFATGHVLRRAENKFIMDDVDSERYNRFSTVWPHSDWWLILHPEALQDKDNMLKMGLANENQLDEAKRAVASASRWATVQIWKPLKTIHRDPLALCDVLSYDFSEWRHRLTDNPLISFPVLSHADKEEKHKWYYLHEMTPNEMYVFKGCDSRQGENGFTGYVGAHTAFILPDSEDKPPRESIEARFNCFWE